MKKNNFKNFIGGVFNKLKQLLFKSNLKKQKNSKQYNKYLQKKRVKSYLVVLCQFLILASFIIVWELMAKNNLINVFIFSSPSRIYNQIVLMLKDGSLYYHSWVTLYETLISFGIATILGTIIAVILWSNNFIKRVLDPYIVVLNSLPKIALGPIIIIWFGLGAKSIIFMAVLIMIIITIISMLHSFNSCDYNKVLMLKSMNASKWQILTKLILPNSLPEFISVLKINVGLAWVGTIMGEYLVSQAGLGYLIIYGGTTFKLTLVMASTIVLCILAAVMYFIVSFIEKKVAKSQKR